jgi:hypothetical protein
MIRLSVRVTRARNPLNIAHKDSPSSKLGFAVYVNDRNFIVKAFHFAGGGKRPSALSLKRSAYRSGRPGQRITNPRGPNSGRPRSSNAIGFDASRNSGTAAPE